MSDDVARAGNAPMRGLLRPGTTRFAAREERVGRGCEYDEMKEIQHQRQLAINDRRRTKAAWKKSTADIELARSTHESRVLAFVDVLQKTIKDHGLPLY